MSRITVLVAAVLLVVPAVAYAAVVAGSSGSQVTRGTVQSFARCYPYGYAVTLNTGTVVVYQSTSTAVYPKNTTPTVGAAVFAITKGTTQCDTNSGIAVSLVSGRSATYVGYSTSKPATTTPPTSGSDSSGLGSGSGFLDKIKSALGNLLNKGNASTNAATQAAQPAAGAAPSGVPFGGAITTPPITCTTPPGAIYVKLLTPPTPIPIICQPGFCKSYLNGPPSFVSQWLLGNLSGPMIPCYVGTVEVGRGYPIGSNPGHGSSGADFPAPPSAQEEKPADPTQCGSIPNPQTPSQKLAGERAVRDALEACNVNVTSSRTGGAACAFGQDGVKGGCTDVGGLQCGTVDNVCNLAKECGGVNLIGGNEGGHKSHDDGWAVDLVPTSSLTSCVQSKYTRIADRIVCTKREAGKCTASVPVPAYQDRYGNRYYFEPTIPGYSTGPNLHVCLAGHAC